CLAHQKKPPMGSWAARSKLRARATVLATAIALLPVPDMTAASKKVRHCSIIFLSDCHRGLWRAAQNAHSGTAPTITAQENFNKNSEMKNEPRRCDKMACNAQALGFTIETPLRV
ncbi:hypothetical protein, partial [Billgrantia desiderata]|uniref:hypothetical protein n=1 Tax=Billgrantia desiderata TaxID=52021 RepID=UPI0015940998